MALRLSVDTSFLVELEGEVERGVCGPARCFLGEQADAEVCVSVVALGELERSLAYPEHPFVRTLRDTLTLLPLDEDIALRYGALARELRDHGPPVCSPDLWIAATSVHHGLPLVAGEAATFTRVPGLQVLRYR